MQIQSWPKRVAGAFALLVALALPELSQELPRGCGLFGGGSRAQFLLGPFLAFALALVPKGLAPKCPNSRQMLYDWLALGAITILAGLTIPLEYRLAPPGPMARRIAEAAAAVIAALRSLRLTEVGEEPTMFPAVAGLAAALALGADFAMTPAVSGMLSAISLGVAARIRRTAAPRRPEEKPERLPGNP